jgi:hypothetical protein
MKGARVYKIFLHPYFEYHQIWLNILMDDHHLSKIKKIETNKLNKQNLLEIVK